jgi:hypothetical protein
VVSDHGIRRLTSLLDLARRDRAHGADDAITAVNTEQVTVNEKKMQIVDVRWVDLDEHFGIVVEVLLHHARDQVVAVLLVPF